jgi:hypothetical protein
MAFFLSLNAISSSSNSHNEPPSVAGMRVHDADCSRSGIQRDDPPKPDRAFLQIVSDVSQ